MRISQWRIRSRDMESRLQVLRAVKKEEDKKKGRASLISRTKEKRRDYWKKMEEIHKLRRSMRARSCYITENADISNIDTAFVETYELDNDEILVGEAASDPLDINEYDLEKETKNPRIKLSYPEDFEEVRNLPSKRMKKVAKKRVKSWVHKTLLCLTTNSGGFGKLQLWLNYTKLWSSLPRICARQFWGRTLSRARRRRLPCWSSLRAPHTSLKSLRPRATTSWSQGTSSWDNLFDPLQQETVFNDINYKKPKLLWVALPCTKWSQWQRLNYAQRRQALRRARAEHNVDSSTLPWSALGTRSPMVMR